MPSHKFISSRSLSVLFALAFIVGLGLFARAQNNGPHQTPYVDDWTHHHVIFSNPGTRDDAKANRSEEKWLKTINDPRFQIQQSKRQHGERWMDADADHGPGDGHDRDGRRDHGKDGKNAKIASSGLEKDWDEPLGGGSSLTWVVGTVSGNVSGSSTLAFGAPVSVTLTANAPVAESGTFNLPNTPGNPSTLVVGGMTYVFSNGTIATPAANNTCNIDTGGNKGTALTNLAGAMGDLTDGPAGSTTTWLCSTTTAQNFSVSGNFKSSGANQHFDIQATTAGSTAGFGTPAVGSTNFTWTLNSAGSDGTPDSTHFNYWSGAAVVSSAQLAANIVASINLNATITAHVQAEANVPASGDVTFTKTTSGGSISITATSFASFTGTSPLNATGVQATVQPNAYPAKWGPSLTAFDCTKDYVAYPTGQLGVSGSAATIVAYNNLYAGGCTTGAVPSANWAYYTGAATVTTSPFTSEDGKYVAFIQSTATSMSLVTVQWAASTTLSTTSPGTPTTASPNISACVTAPCMTVTAISATNGDAYSSPYYDYASDALYVGDNAGNLYKVSGVFYSASAPAVSSILLTGATHNVASPVYDSTSGCVFVGDSDGYLYSVSSGVAGTVCTSTTFGNFGHSELMGNGSANQGIFDGVLVDSVAETVYAFVTDSRAIGACAAGNNCVAEFGAATITSSSTTAAPIGAEPIGTGAAGYNLYSGSFDNLYFQSSAPSGNLYVVGNTGVTTGANLYAIPITSSAMGTPTTPVTLLTPNAANAYPWPSPLTEFCNAGAGSCAVISGVTQSPSVDYILFSVNRGNKGTCTNTVGSGCILSYNVSNPGSALPAPGVQNYTTPGTTGCWATGGIVLDNDAAVASGASEVYFIGLNGAAAGGPNGAASVDCGVNTAQTVDAIQAAQNNP